MLNRLSLCLLFLTTIHPLSSYRIRGRHTFKGFGSFGPFGVESSSDFLPVNYENFGSAQEGDRRFGFDQTPTSYFQKPRFGRWINQLSEQRPGKFFGRRRHHWGKRHFRPHFEEEEEVFPVRRRFRHRFHSRLRHRRHRRRHSIHSGFGVIKQIPLSEGVLSEDKQHLDFNGAQFPIVSENNAPLVAVLEISSDLQAPQSFNQDRNDSEVKVIYSPETQNIRKRRRQKVVFASNDESQLSEQPSSVPQKLPEVNEQPSFVPQEIPEIVFNQPLFVPQEVPEIVVNQPLFVPEEQPQVDEQPSSVPQEEEQPSSVPQEQSQEVEQPSSVPEEQPQVDEKPSSIPQEQSQEVEQPSSVSQEQSQEVEQPSFVFQEIPQTEKQTSLITQEVPESIEQPPVASQEVPESIEQPPVASQEVPEVTNQPTVTPQENAEVAIKQPEEIPQVNGQSPVTPQEIPRFPQLNPEPQAAISNETNQVIDQTAPVIQQTPPVVSQEDTHNFDTSYDFKLKDKTGKITIRSPKKSKVPLEDTVQITLK